MAITKQQLTQAQKQLRVLFKHRVTVPAQTPVWLNDWYTVKRTEAQTEEPDAYLWGQKCVKGVAAPDASQGRLDVYVVAHPGKMPFQRLLSKFFPGMTTRVVVAPRFRAVQGLGAGAQITLGNGTGGKIALFLKDPAGQTYALTCNHVLDAPPADQPVFSGSRRIGSLFTRVEIMYGPQAIPNLVDCALVKIDSGAGEASHSLPMARQPFAAVQRAALGSGVNITNVQKNASGSVETLADLEIDYPLHQSARNTADFEGLVAITGATVLAQGDSGSLVSVANAPVGMVMAVADSAFTTDTPPVSLGKIVIACDLLTVINELVKTGKVGSLTPAS